MSRDLRVGIIGASAERGWARDSHVPAVQRLNGLELAAVVSGSQAGADAAAKAFGVAKAYAQAEELFRDPEIDLVAVAVKVPDHRDLVLGALKAGKHVYCEWPLGRDTKESEELAAAAKIAGVHCVIGLQTRSNPVALRAGRLLREGVVGRVLSAHILSTTMAFGPKVEAAMKFSEDGTNGVTLATIQGGHTLDLAIAVLGEFQDVAGLATTQFPEVWVSTSSDRSPEAQARSIPDHLLVQARLTGGVAVGIEVAGGRPPESTPFLLQVTGEKGELLLQGGAARGFQSGTLQLRVNGRLEEVPAGELEGMPESAFNVAGVYAALRDDIRRGSRSVPDFEHAVGLSRLVDDALASSREGVRRAESKWPKKEVSPVGKG